MSDILYEDRVIEKKNSDTCFFNSEHVDFIKVSSSRTPGVYTAAVIYKPDKPSAIIVTTHGWHMSVMQPFSDSSNPHPGYLTVQVDMRGRAYSTGNADCNGLELFDIYDVIEYVKKEYASYIVEPGVMHYVGGSGGGGNGYAIIAKFPDLFHSAVVQCGISDYAKWYTEDIVGEFRDELDIWVGCSPSESPEAYNSRSGIALISNVITPLLIQHGDCDIRVPVSHARDYYRVSKDNNKNVSYTEFKNVGGKDHWDNLTGAMRSERDRECYAHLESYSKSKPSLPVRGKMLVGGYLVTNHFSVFMDKIDQLGEIEYDLETKAIVTMNKKKFIVSWN